MGIAEKILPVMLTQVSEVASSLAPGTGRLPRLWLWVPEGCPMGPHAGRLNVPPRERVGLV